MSEAKNILVAEDARQDFILLQAALEEAGLPHHLQNVRDGLEVVAYLKGEAPFSDRRRFPFPDLLLMDVHMPKAGGFEVLNFLRERPEFKVPAVIFSGSMLASDRLKAMNLGAAECFKKPDDLDELITLVQTIHHRWLEGAHV